MLPAVAVILALLALPARAQTPEDAAANRLFVEAVQLWNRAEGEPVAERAVTLQRVQSNLKTIIDQHGGSSLAVRLVIGETVGPLSVTRVERASSEAQVHARVGLAFRDCLECPEMVRIPAGSTRLASRIQARAANAAVTIATPIAVGMFEITFAEWDACVAQGGCRHRPQDNGWGRGRQPVLNISWRDAQDYVAWLSKRTGKAYRLLSEAEWEYAAQAGVGREASVRVGANEANCDGCGSRWDGKQAAPVGSFPANAFGLHDMLGNVWEWTADCWDSTCSSRVLRGGSWFFIPGNASSAYRLWGTVDSRRDFIGFRVARNH